MIDILNTFKDCKNTVDLFNNKIIILRKNYFHFDMTQKCFLNKIFSIYTD